MFFSKRKTFEKSPQSRDTKVSAKDTGVSFHKKGGGIKGYRKMVFERRFYPNPQK
jgi:hypothetical protein